MILIDDLGHMVSDTSEEELHSFALKAGLKREWFQNKNKRHLHYDLTTEGMIQKALLLGAEKVSPKELYVRAWWYERRV